MLCTPLRTYSYFKRLWLGLRLGNALCNRALLACLLRKIPTKQSKVLLIINFQRYKELGYDETKVKIIKKRAHT